MKMLPVEIQKEILSRWKRLGKKSNEVSKVFAGKSVSRKRIRTKEMERRLP